MHFFDLVGLGLRGLARRPIRTTLTVLGIVVAVASMVVFLSLGEGIRRALGQEISNIGPDVQVTLAGSDPAQFGGSIPEVPREALAKLEKVKSELGLERIIPLTLTARGSFSGQGYLIEGYPTDTRLTDIYPNFKLKEGRWLDESDSNKMVAIVGAKAAEQGKLSLGKDVRFNRNNFFKVVGILEEGGGFTDSFIFVPLEPLSQAIGIENKIGLIALKLKDPSQARNVADEISKKFPDLQGQTQGDILQVLDKAIALGDAIRFGISLIALIVGALAVANTMMMGVYERTREFGIIRAIGAGPAFIFRLVILESILLALVGGLGGVLLGYLGTIAVNLAVQNLTSVPVAMISLRLVLFALAIAGALGVLSGILPARTASRLRITEALGRN